MSTTIVVAGQDPCLNSLSYSLGMMVLGQRVAQRRDELGWSQAKLAVHVTRAGFEITQGGIDKIEKRPSPKSRPRCLPELATALGVSQQWLITGHDRPLDKVQKVRVGQSKATNSTKFTLEQWQEFRDSCIEQFETAGLDISAEKRDKLFDLMWWAFEKGAAEKLAEQEEAASINENN